MWLGGDEYTELFVDVLLLYDLVHELDDVVEAEMAVLQQHPAALVHHLVHESASRHFLTLTH